MHKVEKSKRSVHVVVALYDNKTGVRIENVTISGSVMELGLRQEDKVFESMSIANTITYGNYFSMPSKDIYHIKLSIQLKSGKQLEAKFTHSHYIESN